MKPGNLDEEKAKLMQGDAVKTWLEGEIAKAEKGAEGAKE